MYVINMYIFQRLIFKFKSSNIGYVKSVVLRTLSKTWVLNINAGSGYISVAKMKLTIKKITQQPLFELWFHSKRWELVKWRLKNEEKSKDVARWGNTGVFRSNCKICKSACAETFFRSLQRHFGCKLTRYVWMCCNEA